MKTPAEIVLDLMNETPEETETRRALAKAQRESIEEDEEIEQLNDVEQGYKDSGMRPSDFL